MPTAWAKNNQGNSAKGSALKIARRSVKTAYFAIAFENEEANSLVIEPVQETSIGHELYIVIETENLQEHNIKVNVMQGVEKVLAEENAALKLMLDGSETVDLEAQVGGYAADKNYSNADDLKNLAIFKVSINPADENQLKEWQAQLNESSEQISKLYLAVDVHSPNDLEEQLIDYQGYAASETDTANFFLNEKNNWMQVVQEEHVCVYCDDEITLAQVKKTIGGTVSATRVANINKILPFMNKYRKDFGLDTCLKKLHFIAQVTHESDRFKVFEEYEKWSYWNKRKKKANSLPGVFNNKEVLFDETMGTSLLDHLSSIFVVKDKDEKVIAKTNAQLKKLLIDDKVKVVDKKLYTNYQQGEKLLKTVNQKITDKDGKEVEEVKYKVYLKNHSHFGVPLLSRMYAPYTGDKRGLGNGDELTRDGWKYKGRGLKQLTGIGNYKSFSKYRNRSDITFNDDASGDIDFSANDDKSTPQDVKKGNYVKVAEPIYAVQSALYFWNEGTKYKSKYAVEHAENDDVVSVSKAVNLYDSGGLPSRKKYYKNGRKKDAFDIVRHHKDIYDNGTKAQKKEAKDYFEKWKDDDAEAKKIFDEIEKNEKAAASKTEKKDGG